MGQEYNTMRLKLDGKQSISIPIHIKKNGKYITEDVDIIVRGFLKFSDTAYSDVTLYESEEYQVNSANNLEDKTIVHPVLFTSDRITISNGRGIITLLARSEDIFEDTSSLQNRAGSSISDEQIISDGGIPEDEQITEPTREPSTIIVESGVIREPYKISIQVTVIPQTEGGLYGQTIDRGTNPIVESQTDSSSLFLKNKERINSNLIIECYGENDWVPTITSILAANSASAQTTIQEIADLSYSTSFGASMLYDAIVTAADLMSDNSIDDKKKLIYVFTDNESTTSIYSLDEAISEVNAIDGENEVPLMIANMSVVSPETLSVKANTTDTRDINKMAFETGGQALTVTSSDYMDDVAGIFYSEATGALGYGTYEFIADLGEESLINSIVANFNIPVSNANATWTIETSVDGYNFTPIGENYDYDEAASLTGTYSRYIKFKITLITGFNIVVDEYSSYPSSPSLTSIQIIYNISKVAYLYLNVEEEDIIPHHITLAVNANEVNEDQIKVGVAKSNSATWADYDTSAQPSVGQNGKVVIPLRFSQNIAEFQQEPLNKIDSFTLKAEHASWDPYATVILYNKSDEVIPSNYYKLYPRNGLVILSNPVESDYSNGDYKIGILNGNDYKIGLKLTNKSNSTSLEIYGMGYLYSTGRDLLPPVSKAVPEATNVIITNEIPHRYSVIEASYTYYDSNFDPEDTSKTIIKWYINGKHIDYLDGLTRWNDITNPLDPIYINTSASYPDESELGTDNLENWVKKQGISILNSNDRVYYEIQVSDGNLYGVKKKSNVAEVIESTPVMDQIYVRGLDTDNNVTNRLASDTIAVIRPSLDDAFYSDIDINRSEIMWYVNSQLFKKGFYGDVGIDGSPIDQIMVNELGKEEFVDYGLRINNTVMVRIVPRTDTAVGDPIESDPVIVQNSLPRIYNLAYAGTAYPSNRSLVLTWDFFDFEITALGDIDTTGQEDKTMIELYVQNPGYDFEHIYTYNKISDDFNEVFENTDGDIDYTGHISVDFVTHSITIDSAVLFVGQRWKAELTPHDRYDSGTKVISDIITISASGN